MRTIFELLRVGRDGATVSEGFTRDPMRLGQFVQSDVRHSAERFTDPKEYLNRLSELNKTPVMNTWLQDSVVGTFQERALNLEPQDFLQILTAWITWQGDMLQEIRGMIADNEQEEE